MITLEDEPLKAPDALALHPTAGPNDTDAATDTDRGLLRTFSSRLHCRTPMKRVDLEELSVRQPIRVEGNSVIRGRKGPAPEGMVTYRCACGFTMDAPLIAMEFPMGYPAAS
jgi:hypothetical protein